jgi:hypothetical protein
MTDLFNTGVRPAIDAYLLAKSKEERNYGNYWSASSAGYCMRLNIMRRLGVPKVPELEDNATKPESLKLVISSTNGYNA